MARHQVPAVSLARAKWSVLWMKNGEVIWTDFGSDYHRALEIYTKAVQAGKKAATLRCNNVGHPPPTKITEAQAWKIVKRKGKKYKQRVTVNRMEELNRKGWWWCPYCIKLRQFERQDGFVDDDGQYVPQDGMYCGMCGISNYDRNVWWHNPHAQLMEFRKRQRGKRSSGSKRRRR